MSSTQPTPAAAREADRSPANALHRLVFDNRFNRALPADPEPRNFRRQVQGACYSRVAPSAVAAPRLIAHSREMAALLGLSEDDCQDPLFAEVFAGNRVLPGMDPQASCYGGHQFGHWAGQLGDGRAINLGEALGTDGRHWWLQLKGAGPTPYSRSADGLAVMRSSLREFLCSEAMHHLGVPTTRALSLVGTGEPVLRDMFYDGHPRIEPGAVVCRVAPSFTRFGHFQIFTQRGDIETLRRFAEHTLATDFSHLGAPTPATYARCFDEVCRRTAELVVHWMRVGFVHGVLNTDNMSILGLTIDYGPYGWLEDYDPQWTPNTTDAQGRRYCFGRQPEVAQWNLLQLAYALYPLVGEVEPLQQSLNDFAAHYQRGWTRMMASKLGLSEYAGAADDRLFDELLDLLGRVETDMTLFFRRLADPAVLERQPGEPAFEAFRQAPLGSVYYREETLDADYGQALGHWLEAYHARLQRQPVEAAERRQAMHRVNPLYVPRNYLAQQAIDAVEAGDPGPLHEWLEVLRNPYSEQPGQQRFAEKRPEWARNRAGCSMLSCSS